MSNNPFNQYEEVEVSENIKKRVHNFSSELMNPKTKTVFFKYVFLFICSLFLSLAVCPQRGVGLFGGSYPIFHKLLHHSQILCGLYCGFIFFITTHVLSFFLMGHFERLVVVRRVSYLPPLLMSLFFALSMTPFYSTLELSISYFTSWLSVVVVGYMSLTIYYNKLHIQNKVV